MLLLKDYDYMIKCYPDKVNIVADALNRERVQVLMMMMKEQKLIENV